MAELILPKIEPPMDSDRISYDEAKAADLTIIGNDFVPKVAAIVPRLVPGMWHVEMRNHGLSLGVIADRFSSEEEAIEWARSKYPSELGPDLYGGYNPSCIYTPTEGELKMLHQAPKWLDLITHMVKISPVGSTNWENVRIEHWASKEEALQRVTAFQSSDMTAELHGRYTTHYARCVEDIKGRAMLLKTINGDVSKLADGSIWETPEFQGKVRRSGAQSWPPIQPKSWDLYLYKDPQRRTFYSEFYSAKRILASSLKRVGFRSKQDAAAEGFRIMANSKEYVAMSVWHSSAAVACDSILRN